MIGLIKMFRDRSRIRKVAIIKDGAAMLPSQNQEDLTTIRLLAVRLFS